MQGTQITNPKRFFLIWGLALAGLLGAGIAGNLALGFQVERWRGQDPKFHLAAASRFMTQKDYLSARTEIDKALDLAPALPEPHVTDGHLHYELKQWEKAIAAYKAAIAQGSPNPYLYGRILWCLMNLGRFEEAATFGLDCVAQGHGTASLGQDTAEACLRAGKPTEAAALLEAALRDSPDNTHLLERLAFAYQRAGRQEKTDALLKQIDTVRLKREGQEDSAGGDKP